MQLFERFQTSIRIDTLYHHQKGLAYKLWTLSMMVHCGRNYRIRQERKHFSARITNSPFTFSFLKRCLETQAPRRL